MQRVSLLNMALYATLAVGCSTARGPIELQFAASQSAVAGYETPGAVTLVDALGGLPVVQATVQGEHAWFVLDSGASRPVLAQWYLAARGIHTSSSYEMGFDHAGRPLRVRMATGVQAVVQPLGRVRETTWAVVDVPEVFRRQNIAGFLSPQTWADARSAVVIDFRTQSLKTTAVENAPSRSHRGEWASACGGGYVADTRVGQKSARLLVDTGSARTDLLGSVDYPTTTYALQVAGGEVTAAFLGTTEVTVGGTSLTASPLVIRGQADHACPRDGALGMDVLRSCVVTFYREGARVTCSR